MKTKKISRVLSLLLVFALILGNTPIGQVLAYAAGDTGSVQSLEIIAFEELAPEIEVQRVPSGTDESELNLPDMLMATVNLGSDDTSITTDPAIDINTMDIPVPVTWTSSPSYNGDNDGEYIFIPLIENFTINAVTPIIRVLVGETAKNIISDFTELTEEVRWQNTMTPQFPETVEGIIDGATVQIPVTWEADHPYDADCPQRGLYVFTAVLSEDYETAYGMELPRITVYIPQNAGMMMRMAGSGTTESPLEIYTASQLAEIAVLVNSKLGGLERFLFNNADAAVYLKLMNDIDLSGYQGGEGWMPIGTDSYPFKGTFDGNNKVITGLKINHSDTECQGLFGYISGGTVRNLGVININIQGGLNVGGVAGYLENSGIIENCYSTGTISSEIPFCYVGGVVGTSYATVRNCYSTCSVSAATSSSSCTVGGVAGRSYGSIVNCYSSGSVNATALYGCCVGGVVGITVGATVNNCYSTGSVSGTGGACYVGGVIGFDYGSSVIKCCVALNSSISFSSTGDANVARVVGLGDESLSNNYAFTGIAGSWNDKAHDKKNGADKTAEYNAPLCQDNFLKNLS